MNREFLQLAGRDIKARLPNGWGFILLAATFGEDGQLVYTSDIDRKDAINVLKEFLIKAGAEEDWMKHLK